MRVLSLFDGISCGMVALKRIGISVEAYDAFEIDKYAITVSSRNHPEIVHHGNVFDGDFRKFKGYDLLLGGSPCTYWSIAKQGRETTSKTQIRSWSAAHKKRRYNKSIDRSQYHCNERRPPCGVAFAPLRICIAFFQFWRSK